MFTVPWCREKHYMDKYVSGKSKYLHHFILGQCFGSVHTVREHNPFPPHGQSKGSGVNRGFSHWFTDLLNGWQFMSAPPLRSCWERRRWRMLSRGDKKPVAHKKEATASFSEPRGGPGSAREKQGLFRALLWRRRLCRDGSSPHEDQFGGARSYRKLGWFQENSGPSKNGLYIDGFEKGFMVIGHK